jgi:hypothetical protein
VTLDFEFDQVPGEGFSIAGNGVQYGNFTYSSLPIILGPFVANDEIQWEFVVADLVNPGCLDFIDVGQISCEISSVLFPDPVNTLDIYYVEGMAHLVIPEDNILLNIYAIDGRNIYRKAGFSKNEIVALDMFGRSFGIYLVKIQSEGRFYVGKVYLHR